MQPQFHFIRLTNNGKYFKYMNMKNKSTVLFLSVILFLSFRAGSQTYCLPVVNGYGPSTPGITNVKFADINRTSATNEGYINTNVTGNAAPGSQVSFSITFTQDLSICNVTNLRVWLDANHDFVFNDTTEKLVNVNNNSTTSYTTTVTIPASAVIGVTRLRVAMKMAQACGHTLPTPCNIPADPIDWHGEIEDYNLNISTTVGIEAPSLNISSVKIYPNPVGEKVNIEYFLNTNTEVKYAVYDILGNCIYQANDGMQIHGSQTIPLNTTIFKSDGIYLMKLEAGSQTFIQKIIK